MRQQRRDTELDVGGAAQCTHPRGKGDGVVEEGVQLRRHHLSAVVSDSSLALALTVHTSGMVLVCSLALTEQVLAYPYQ